MSVESTMSKILVEVGLMSKRLERITEQLAAISEGASGPLELWEEKPDMILSRADAKLWGVLRYRTGESCTNGHKDWRYISNGCCVSCLAVRAAAIKRARVHGDV